MPTEVQIYKDGTIVEADIANNAVTVDKIATGAVTDVKIGTGAVTVDKIGTGAVTPGKLSTGGPNWDTAGNLTANGVRVGASNTGYYGDSINLAARVPDAFGGFYIQSPQGTPTSSTWAVFTSTGLSVTGAISATGDITAFSASDQRLKDNITPISDPLSKVLSISGNTFDWNEKSENEGNDVGVIAQEIIEVLPEAVTTRDTGYLAVRYEKLVPLLIEAIKEQNQNIEKLKEEIKNLKNN